MELPGLRQSCLCFQRSRLPLKSKLYWDKAMSHVAPGLKIAVMEVK